jgi:hypothetical protein
MRDIGDLEPEMRGMLFDGGQDSTLKAAETYLNSVPPNFNPSGTSAAESYQRLIGIKGLNEALAAWASLPIDAVQKARLSASVRSADDVHALVSMEKAAAKTLKKITSSSKAIFSDQVVGFTASKAAEMMISHEKPEKQIERIREIANNPELMIEKMSKGVEDIHGVAPETAQALQMSAIRAVQYLASVAPETDSPYALGDKPVPSKAELNIFNERMSILKNPSVILDEMNYGSLTPEHVEIVATVYPKMYDMMRSSVMEELVNAVSKKKQIPYKKKNMISLLLNQDMDSSIMAQNVLQNQMLMNKSQQESDAKDMAMGGGIKPTAKGLGNLSSGTQFMTAMQKSGQRIDRG